MSKADTKRNCGMDIIRCIALFCVISVHFFLNNGFYKETVINKRMYVMVLMRTAFMVCVPLFITLSGYLMSRKKLEKSYYTKITKTLCIYVLASLACNVYKIVFLDQKISLLSTVKGILNFSAAPYAWYIEMYIGLFIMIPFLNLVYNNIPSKNWKRVLILSLLFLTAFPGIINVYDFNSAGWWSNPGMSRNYDQLIPQWWGGIYPLTYYFIGCYLHEYKCRLKKTVNIVLLAAVILVSGTYSFWRSIHTTFIWGAWCNWGSIFNVISTVLVFIFFANLNYDRVPGWISRVLKTLSGLCLGAYLVSWIFDSVFYPILNNNVPAMIHRLEYYIIIVPVICVCSFGLSFVLDVVYKTAEKMISKMLKKK